MTPMVTGCLIIVAALLLGIVLWLVLAHFLGTGDDGPSVSSYRIVKVN